MTDTSDFSNLTVKQLQQELRKRNLSVSGLKAVLIERLEEHDDKNQTNSDLRKRLTNNAPDQHHDNGRVSMSGHHLNHEELKEIRHIERENRKKILLWRKPLVTIHYFLLELFEIIKKEKQNVLKHKKTCTTITVMATFVCLAYMVEGPHHIFIDDFKQDFLWCAYWVGLGILSSVGLGTGLHTFLLYLGPHIAKVTLAAWECGSLNFPEPPYPNEVLCPPESDPSSINIFTIMSKVRLEAVMWGAGTAIGELPPYFMARAARLSGEDDPDNEDLEELEELITSEDKGLFTRLKKAVPSIVERVGFFGILAFASIPNPLFDLAGITCGHCLVPFWTFFGATLIGKSIIKMHIQQTFVIICFSKYYVEYVLMLLGNIPYVGEYIQAPFKKAVQAQVSKLHGDSAATVGQDTNILGFIFEKFVTLMIIYFVVSIVNSLAQSYAKRVDETTRVLKAAQPSTASVTSTSKQNKDD